MQDAGSRSSSNSLLLLRFTLPLAAIPRLQGGHAGFAYVGIPLEEGRKRFWLYHGRYLDLVLPSLLSFGVCRSDEHGHGPRGVQIREYGVARGLREGLIVGY